MGEPKWKGGVAFQYAANATDETGALEYPQCESANIEGEPITYERTPQSSPDPDYMEAAGHNVTWSINGITPDVTTFGKLAAIALGSDAYTTEHTITPADDAKYLNVLVDAGLDLGTSTPTERGIGGKIGNFVLEFPFKEFAKLTVSGAHTDYGTLAAAVAASIPSGVNNRPLSWAGLQETGGFVKLGYNGGAAAADGTVRGVKIEITRGMVPSGAQLNSNQPSKMDGGVRAVFFEVTREFNSKDEYLAWKGQQKVELDVRSDSGTYYARVHIPAAHIVKSYRDDVGSGDDIITATLRCKAFADAGNPVVTIYTKDGTSAVYYS